MSIQIGSVGGASLVSQVTPSYTSQAKQTSSSSGVGEATKVSLSKPAELMAKLQKLKDADPEKLKSVLSDISKQLEDTATKNGDTRLSELASKFASAAETGDLSGLAPSHQHRGGGGGPRGAGGPPPGGGAGGPPPGGPPPDGAGGAGGKGGANGASGSKWQERKSEIDSIFEDAISSIDQALQASTTTSTSA